MREYEVVSVNYPYVTMRILAYEYTFVRTKDGAELVATTSQSQVFGDASVPKALYKKAKKQALGTMISREKKAKKEARQINLF